MVSLVCETPNYTTAMLLHFASASGPKALSPDEIITLSEFRSMRDDFARQFSIGSSLLPVRGHEQVMDYVDFKSKFIGMSNPAAFFHYGLVGNGQGEWEFRLGITAVEITGNSYVTPGRDPRWELIPSAGFQLVTGTWGRHADYFREMRVARNVGDTPVGLIGGNGPAADAWGCAFVWLAEIDMMVQQNGRNKPGANDGDFKIQVSCVSLRHDTTDGGIAGFRHGLCFCTMMKKVSVFDLQLDDAPNATVVYKGKGADLGNLCPPGCGLIR